VHSVKRCDLFVHAPLYQKLTANANRKEKIIKTKIASVSGCSFLKGSAKKIFTANVNSIRKKMIIIIFESWKRTII